MNPAPAISTLASAAGSRAAPLPVPRQACADSGASPWRDAWRYCSRNRRAAASRVRSTSKARSRSAAGSSDFGQRAERLPQQVDRSKSSRRIRGVECTKGRQFTRAANASIYFQGIHVDRPAQARRPRQRLHERQPELEKALQRGPRRGLDQQMRAKVIGAARDQGARRARARWPCRPPALVRGRRRRAETRPGPRCPWLRRAAARAASRAASARRGAPRARWPRSLRSPP